MRAKIGCIATLLFAGVAGAQPAPAAGPDGQPPAPPPAPPLAPPGALPPPAAYPPPAYAPPGPYYGRPLSLQLSPEDAELLARGEISDLQTVGGGLLSIFVGFGVGQAVEGRWLDRGWVFTIGETVSVIAVIDGAIQAFNCDPSVSNCNANGGLLFWGGFAALAGLRIWEIGDAFVAPSTRNAHVRDLRMRLGMPPQPGYALAPYIAPLRGRGGDATVVGLQVNF
jgi:hypothetical protein